MRLSITLALLGALALRAEGQSTHAETYAEAFARENALGPSLRYAIHFDSVDAPRGYRVTLDVRGGPDTLRLALPIWAPGAYRVANFARNVQRVAAQTPDGDVAVVREDSATWRVAAPGGRATIRYRIDLGSTAAAETPNNRSFVRRDGALIDGPQAFMYLVGHKDVPAHVSVEAPPEWRIATGLVPTGAPRTFWAPSYDVLVDSPILLGPLHEWSFAVDGVPHRVAYWPLPDFTPFDSLRFVGSVRRGVEAARDYMGKLPYRDYTFLYLDGSGGGLEHLNSTTIGAPSSALARDPHARVGVTIHEFFHLWNVKRLRPAELGPFDYQRPVRTVNLWWSEGVTDYVAEALARSAGFADETQARDAFASTIQSYLENPARDRVSPERSSWTAWDPPAVNGGYAISYYLQGALLGELLDLELRDRTGLARGMRDLVRLMYARHSGARGFASDDLLHAANDVCGCDLQPFFARHVRSATPPDLERYAALLGWRLVATRAPAVDASGRPLPDLRLGVTPFAGYGSAGGAAGGRLRLSVSDPTSAWGRAGIQGGDELVAIDGRPVATPEAFRAAMGGVRIGDRVRVELVRAGERRTIEVPVTGYERLRASLVDLPTITERQRAMRRAWMTGRP